MPSGSAKHWVFTLNNYDSDIDVAINDYFTSGNIDYIVYQRERGAEGTPHLQGYVAWKHRRTLRIVRTFLDTAHWEIAKGTPAQCIAYCTKADTREPGSEPVTLGTPPGPPGRRTDLEAVKATIDSGATVRETWDQHFGAMVRYHRSFTEYKRIKTSPRESLTKVMLIVGPTGTGKSSYARSLCPEPYYKQASQWWDGYDGQEIVILDDFYGWLPYSEMLRLMDRYPMMVQTKGGQVQFKAKLIVMTANTLPSAWYSKIYSEQKHAAAAFARRIQAWVYMGSRGSFFAESEAQFEEFSAKHVLQLE